MANLDDNTRSFVALGPGTRVGRYVIARPLGSGGMGDVFAADDRNLGRTVALKFLPQHLARNESACQRFGREARAAASLSHPNIVQIFEVDEQFERPYYAMELVDGESLREVVKTRELSIKEFLDIAIQIASGLAEAHQAGIVHRDIKPANILLDKKGRIRIVDFGLAAVSESGAITKPGATMGTMGYLSPEQARAEKVDGRSDIFSLGIVLYELLTRQQPFRRESDAGTLQAILTVEPDPITRYKSVVPDSIQHIVSKALAKNPELRYQHADDLAADLKREQEALSFHSQPPSAVALLVPTRRWPLVAAMSGVVITAVAAMWLLWGGEKATSITAKHRQITFDGDVGLLDVSPDGSKLAFTRRQDLSLNQRLYTQSLSGGDPLLVFEGFFNDIAWSPDGNFVLISAVRKGDTASGAFIIPFMGGAARQYLLRSCYPSCVCWDPSGTAFYYHESCTNPQRHLRVDVRTGDTTAVTLDMPVKWVYNIQCSPDGRRLLFQLESESGYTLWTSLVDGTEPKKVLDLNTSTEQALSCWSADSRSIYLIPLGTESATLLKQRINVKSGAPEGSPQVVLSGFASTGPMALTRQGKYLAYVHTTTSSSCALWSRQGGGNRLTYTREVINASTSSYLAPCLSPDGSKVAYGVIVNNRGVLRILTIRDRTIRTYDLSGRDLNSCAWSPDGSELAVVYQDGPIARLCLVDAASGSLRDMPSSWTTFNAGSFLKWEPFREIMMLDIGNRNVLKLDRSSGSINKLITNDSVGWMASFAPSATGEIAVGWNRVVDRESERRRGLWLISHDGVEQRQLSESKADITPVVLAWSAEGEYVYWRNWQGGHILRTSRDGATTDTLVYLGSDSLAFGDGISISADAKYIFAVLNDEKRDVWLVEDFDPDIKYRPE